MIWESFEKDNKHKDTDITRGVLLITLALATSIDALAVGLSFSFLKINILYASSIIGITAFVMTAIGFWLGRRVSIMLGKRAKLAGGIVLIAIGTKILLEHLL
jgi:putative Mn2+ efflux pump MntP